jgi:hypothetical protein
MKRKPDFIVGAKENPYLKRWWVIPRNKWFNIYLHEILHSDDDRALHDHMYHNCSIILSGGYLEITQKGTKFYGKGSVLFRKAKTAHRLEIPDWLNEKTKTLFITGPRIREWGFHCPKGWRHWTKFVNPNEPGQVGPGCD